MLSFKVVRCPNDGSVVMEVATGLCRGKCPTCHKRVWASSDGKTVNVGIVGLSAEAVGDGMTTLKHWRSIGGFVARFFDGGDFQDAFFFVGNDTGDYCPDVIENERRSTHRAPLELVIVIPCKDTTVPVVDKQIAPPFLIHGRSLT